MKDGVGWIDTHSHIYLSYEGRSLLDGGAESSGAGEASEAGWWKQIEDVLDRAGESGVKRVVVVGIDVPTSKIAAAIAARDRRCSATAGLHPNSAGELSGAVKEELESLAGRPEVAAIGETGLDFYRMGAPPDVQEEAFRFQIDLARRVRKPVVIHVRDAHEAVRSILSDEAGSRGLPQLVMHCFSGSAYDADFYLELGAYLSFAGPITFRTANAAGLRSVAASVPLERCILETDSPFLSPHPFRGQPNEPFRLTLIGKELARLKQLPTERVASATTSNAERLFFSEPT